MKKHLRTTVLPLVVIGLAIVPAAAQRASVPFQPGAPSSASGIDPAAMDRSADACADFYQFACGGWIARHPLPADQSRYGRFDELQERNNAVLREALEAAASSASDPDTAKIGDYYGSCMDEAGIAAKGIAPLKDDFDRIATLGSTADLPPVLAALHRKGVAALFRFGSTPDFKDASSVIAGADQGGLGLPDRDYYVKDDANTQKLRAEYTAHVDRMLRLAGEAATTADEDAQAVMRIETALARAALDRVSRRSPAKVYHKMPLDEVRALMPSFNWTTYLRGVQAGSVDVVNVSEPDFMRAVNQVLASTPLPDLRTYLRWHLLNASAEFLPAPFVDENFAFRRTLTGAKEQRPRWKRCVDYTDGDLGEVVGKAYVARAFGPEGKERTVRMVEAIERAMGRDITSIDWMSDATRKQAAVKLAAVANKIGYPEKWRDYSALRIVRGDALGNSQRANEFEFARQLGKIGKPVDKTEWQMTPPTVNAYYNPLENNINFPAGILQPPFFNNAADDAVNFGAAGAVVGHELSHGFDDQGRQFDAQGNLRDWWTPADAKAFEDRAACLANQYSGYTAVADVKLNGKLTLGENTADNGGLRLGWMALTESGAARPLGEADGFSPEQRFFIGWGQMWCENRTDESARLRAATDPHSPGRYRVNGVVSNFPEFQKAFSCPAAAPMVNAPACRVW
ncbi:MAG: putative endopeptidase [Acidobacteriota bacterium]|jgi:endothelin-converting enzyme/putative endopeptidase